ncbi:MAG: hypothetical protein LUC44_03660, partial [Prevotellaceae bacterium]|nr:hypothetical protein [Prevotellaceae bacterium]
GHFRRKDIKKGAMFGGFVRENRRRAAPDVDRRGEGLAILEATAEHLAVKGAQIRLLPARPESG